MGLTRRTVLLATPAVLCGPRARAALPPAQDLAWRDAGGRALRVLVRWPEASVAGDWPLVLYSHGLGGSREGGAVWGEAWARAGFVVVHLQHAGSDLQAVRAQGVRGAAGAQQALERLHDVRQALDMAQRLQAQGDGPWARVRPQGAGLAGHSFGAATTLAMAGQRHPAAGAMDEPRLAAFIALSPALPRGDARAAFAGVTRPLLCITGSEDGDVVGNGATPERRRAVFDALPPGHKAQLVLDGADHMTFGGTPRLALPWRPRAAATQRLEPAHHALVAAISTDWWRARLLGDAAAAARLAQPAGLGAADLWRQG